MSVPIDPGTSLTDNVDTILLAGATGLHQRFLNLYSMFSSGIGPDNLLLGGTYTWTGDHTFSSTKLHVLSSGAAFDLIIAVSTVFTADRTLNINIGDSNKTLTLAGDFATSGTSSLTLTTSGATNVTLPTTGTLSTLAGVETLTNKTLTSPAINTPTITAPTFSGTATGTYTLGGSPTISSPAINTPTITAPTFSGTATGTYTLGGSPTISGPSISAPVLSGTTTGTYTLGGSPTISSPTINTPTISAPVLSGSASGTYTLGGSPTISSPAINTPTISAPTFSGTATGTYTLGGSPTISSPAINTPTISTPTLSGTVSGTYTLSSPTVSGTVAGDHAYSGQLLLADVDPPTANYANRNGIVKAWATVDSSGADLNSYNVSSTSRPFTGTYLITIDTDFTATMCPVACSYDTTSSTVNDVYIQITGSGLDQVTLTTSNPLTNSARNGQTSVIIMGDQ